jgi:hypothetical protein
MRFLSLVSVGTPLLEATMNILRVPEDRQSVILRSHNEYPGTEFYGAAWNTETTFEQFEAMVNTYLEGPTNKECVDALDMWLVRPSWYVPRKADILAARRCVETVRESVSEDSSLLNIVSEMENAIFSEDADDIIESEGTGPAIVMETHIGMKRYVSGISQVKSILESQSLDVSDIQALLADKNKGADLRYFNRILNSDFVHPLMVHLPSFVDEYRANINVWRLAMSLDFDKLDQQSVLSRKIMIENPDMDIRPRILSFPDSHMGSSRRGWMLTAHVIRQIDVMNGSDIYKNCLPTTNEDFVEWISMGHEGGPLDPKAQSSSSVLLEAFDRGHESDSRIYENTFSCVLSTIRANHVKITQEHVPGLMFLARIAFSASSAM